MRVPCPSYRLTLEDQEITASVASRLLRLTLTEYRLQEADQLDIVLADPQHTLAIPERGGKLHVWLGWKDTGLIHKGHFTVDEIEYSGPPDTLTVRARSATFSGIGQERTERSWHNVTLADIVKTIAQRQSIQPQIDAILGATRITHIDQVYEGDLHFLTRLAQRYGAFMTVKNGALLFMPLGSAKSVQGEAFPETYLTPPDCMSYRYHIAERERYAGVRAYWYKSSQASSGKRASVVIGQENGRGFKVLPEHYTNEEDARAAAKAEWQRIQRSQATLHLTFAARPELFPEKIITCGGFASEITNTRWSIAQATHTLESSGFTTRLELEVHDDPVNARHRTRLRSRGKLSARLYNTPC